MFLNVQSLDSPPVLDCWRPRYWLNAASILGKFGSHKTTCCTKQPAVHDVQRVVLCEPIFAIFIEKLCIRVWSFTFSRLMHYHCFAIMSKFSMKCMAGRMNYCQLFCRLYCLLLIPRTTMTLGCVLWRQWSRLLATSRESTLIWTR